MWDTIGGRKFIFGILLVLCALVLVLAGKIPGGDFTTFAAIVGGIYVVGNIGATVANGAVGNLPGQQIVEDKTTTQTTTTPAENKAE